MIAMARVDIMDSLQEADSVAHIAHNQSVAVIGKIRDEPDIRPGSIRYVIDVERVENIDQKVRGRVLVIDRGKWPRHFYGEEVRVQGKLALPKSDDAFDYAAYLSIDGISVVMDRANITTMHAARSTPQGMLISIKSAWEQHVNRIFPEPTASLLAGLLLGSRRGMPENLAKDMQRTGLTHIVAISGTNITIIIVLLESLLFWLPKRVRAVPLFAGIALFTIFVGASASVVRAAIMGILGFISLEGGRASSRARVILLAATCMTAWNPRSLWYDVGFHLSFAAVIGLMLFADAIDRRLARIPNAWNIRRAVSATLAAQIATTPFSMVNFHSISLIAPLANVLVAPLVPFAMLFGFLGAATTYVLPHIGALLAFIGFGFLSLIIVIAQSLALIPWCAITW
jgi:competence protein ComEC